MWHGRFRGFGSGIMLIYNNMDERIFKSDAKSLVDMMFNIKLFKDDVTRDSMNEMEDFINYLLSSRYDTYVKFHKISERIAALPKCQ